MMSQLTVSHDPLFVALLHHLWQTTLFTVAIWLLAGLMRSNRAQTRFRLWLLASVKFLLPLSLLITAGQHLRPLRSQATAPIAFTLMMQGTPNDAAVEGSTVGAVNPPAAASTASEPFDTTRLLLTVWAIGAVGLLTMWLRRWAVVRRAVRGGSRTATVDGIPAITTTAQLEPGVFGILRPMLILPAGIHDRLTPVELRGILAHELSHVRRRDNLTATVHMLVQAVFWFHPMVWVIGARMLQEREAACDAAVLESHVEAETYAEGILKICRMYVETPVPCVAGVTGADLKRRIVRIVSGDFGRKLNLGRRAALTVLSLAAVVTPVLFGVLRASELHAAEVREAPDGMADLPYDVASTPALRIPSQPPKPPPPPPVPEPPPLIVTAIDPKLVMTNVHIRSSNPYSPGSGYGADGLGGLDRPAGFRSSNNTVAEMISFSYGVQARQIIDGPRWIDTERYDIAADVGTGQPSPEKIHAMMRRLLADRFGIRLRPARRDLQVYVVTVSREGHHLRPDGRNPHGLPSLGLIAPGSLMVSNASVRDFFSTMQNFAVDRPLVDRTGLTGRWTFDLQWHPDAAFFAASRMPEPRNPADDKSPPLLTAIREQLGLDVEPTTLPMNVLVLDRATRPKID